MACDNSVPALNAEPPSRYACSAVPTLLLPFFLLLLLLLPGLPNLSLPFIRPSSITPGVHRRGGSGGVEAALIMDAFDNPLARGHVTFFFVLRRLD